MRDEDERRVLEQVFGSDSDYDTENDENDNESENEREWKWESIEQVNGLWLCPHFLSPRSQSLILSSIQSDNWFPDPSINQAMRFGLQHLPQWALSLAQSIRRSAQAQHPSPFSPHLLHREPFFDQMIANLYHPGEGICAHVDLLRFDDGIAILSLQSSCVMHFTPLSNNNNNNNSIPVLLTPGSLILMSGEVRYQWKHEINRAPGFQIWNGQELTQSKRISITLRKLS